MLKDRLSSRSTSTSELNWSEVDFGETTTTESPRFTTHDDLGNRRSGLFDFLLNAWALEDNWDGNGSKAPSRNLVRFVTRWTNRNLTRNELLPDDFAVGVNGSIIYFWDDEIETEIEFEGEHVMIVRAYVNRKYVTRKFNLQ